MNVIKLGTNCIFEGQHINYGLLRRKAKEIKDDILVVSGAIKLGKIMKNEKRSNYELSSVELQGYASVGQVQLMHILSQCFNRDVAQILLTMEDMKHENNIKELIPMNIRHGRLNVVNYNDSIDFAELRKDNDTLAAQLAIYCNARRLIILGRYNGFCAGGRLIKEVTSIDESVYALCNGKSNDGNGGFKTKLDAARIMMHTGKEMIVGNVEYGIADLIEGRVERTIFY